ncbi:conjugal transfer protein TraR [bacterium]|nr:conjugal transfer protein TraR [bacterium]
MTSEEKAEIKLKIISGIDEIKKDIVQLEKLTAPISPDNAIGRITRMEAINSRSVNEARLNQSKLKLRQLENMAINIEKADFGLCVVCKQSIPVERLIWLPESDRCVKCAG